MSLVPIRQEVARAWVDLMAPAVELAKAVANTEFVPKGLRGNPAGITAAILYGDEIGLPPMSAIRGIAMVDGTPTLYAETMRGLVLADGHDLWVEEATATRVTVAGRRKDSDQTSRVTWTMDDARRANIAGKPPWRLYPRQMLLARASAELARAVFADAIGGMAAYEEIAEPADAPITAPALAGGAEGDAVAAPTRKRQRSAVTVSASPEAPPPEPKPLPPLPGEPDEPQPEPPSEPPTITDAQRRKMNALFREKDISDRTRRLRFASAVAQRPLQSSLELTVEEASRVIDALEEWNPSDPQTQAFPEGY